MKIAIRIPVATPVPTSLELCAAAGGFDGLELTGEQVADGAATEELLSTLNLTMLTLDQPVPLSVSRYLAETTPAARAGILAHLGKTLEWVAGLDTLAATLDLGLDEPPPGKSDQPSAAHLEIVNALLAPLTAYPLRLALPYRLPPARSRAGNQRLLRLVEHVMHPSCGVAAELFPEELDAREAPADVLKAVYPHLAVLRLHYDPALGIRLREDFHARWANCLQEHSFRGVLVFAPAVHGFTLFRNEYLRLKDAVETFWRPRA